MVRLRLTSWRKRMYIIIKNRNSWKGKGVAEMQRNLQSEGWPSEVSPETLDKIKSFEKKEGRPFRKSDAKKLGK